MNRTYGWMIGIALVALGIIGAVACGSTTDASTTTSGKPVLTLKGGAR